MSINLEDFILPVVIEKSSDYNRSEVKQTFERLCFILAKQAFWLELFELLDKRSAYVEAIDFNMQNWRVDEFMTIVAKEGAPEAKVNTAHRALSKARGKFGTSNMHQMRMHISTVFPQKGQLRLADKEKILEKALGSDLYGLRLATVESKMLSEEVQKISAAAMQALSGKRSNRL